MQQLMVAKWWHQPRFRQCFFSGTGDWKRKGKAEKDRGGCSQREPHRMQQSLQSRRMTQHFTIHAASICSKLVLSAGTVCQNRIGSGRSFLYINHLVSILMCLRSITLRSITSPSQWPMITSQQHAHQGWEDYLKNILWRHCPVNTVYDQTECDEFSHIQSDAMCIWFSRHCLCDVEVVLSACISCICLTCTHAVITQSTSFWCVVASGS